MCYFGQQCAPLCSKAAGLDSYRHRPFQHPLSPPKLTHTRPENTHDGGKVDQHIFTSSTALPSLQTSFLFFLFFFLQGSTTAKVRQACCQTLGFLFARCSQSSLWGREGPCTHPPILTGKAKKKKFGLWDVIPRLRHNARRRTRFLCKLSANPKKRSFPKTEGDKAAIQVSAHCLPP